MVRTCARAHPRCSHALGCLENMKRQIYVAPDTTPRAQLLRLCALLERNPDTLKQLARQEDVLEKQKADQQDALVGTKTGGASGEGGGGGRGDDAPAVRIFVGGDRSQVRWGMAYMWWYQPE